MKILLCILAFEVGGMIGLLVHYLRDSFLLADRNARTGNARTGNARTGNARREGCPPSGLDSPPCEQPSMMRGNWQGAMISRKGEASEEVSFIELVFFADYIEAQLRAWSAAGAPATARFYAASEASPVARVAAASDLLPADWRRPRGQTPALYLILN